jgi:ubiquinol-cytochrome c reductase cytochrome c1 subunit
MHMIRFKKTALAPATLALLLALGAASRADDAAPAATPAAPSAEKPAPAAAPATAAAPTPAKAAAAPNTGETAPTDVDADAEQPSPPRQHWSFSGLFGTYDQAQLQRGFKVYREVCSTCHRLSIPFRTLEDPSGPGFSEAQIKALAATYQVTNDSPNDKGEIFKRPGIPSDIIPPPEAYPNPEAAAATFGKAPPDMWVLAKARKYERGFPWFIFDALPFVQYQEVGADYVDAILNGYTHPKDPNWNLYFPGHKIAMPQPPISDGAVEYTDGTPAKTANYAQDVTAFLSWAAEPTLAERKKIGLRVMVFLIIFAGLLYFTKRRVWDKIH